MANEQVLTAEQVFEQASYYLPEKDVEFIKKRMNLPTALIAINIANPVSRILSIRFKSPAF